MFDSVSTNQNNPPEENVHHPGNACAYVMSTDTLSQNVHSELYQEISHFVFTSGTFYCFQQDHYIEDHIL